MALALASDDSANDWGLSVGSILAGEDFHACIVLLILVRVDNNRPCNSNNSSHGG
jgi:hypothetical protein